MGDLNSNNYRIGLVSFQTNYCVENNLLNVGLIGNFGSKHECC